jgi:type IV secretory pathway VirB2 component (pilin)
MAVVVQQSLFEVGGGTPMAESARWIEGVLLGEIALGVSVIAVALIGGLMLTGRLPLREGMRVVVGCFVLLGAPVIAVGFVGEAAPDIEAATPPVTERPRPDFPQTRADPYAGA